MVILFFKIFFIQKYINFHDLETYTWARRTELPRLSAEPWRSEAHVYLFDLINFYFYFFIL